MPVSISISAQQFDSLRQQLAKTSGVSLTTTSPTSGALVNADIAVAYNYDSVSEKLTVTLAGRHSQLARDLPEFMIDHRIKHLLESALKKAA